MMSQSAESAIISIPRRIASTSKRQHHELGSKVRMILGRTSGGSIRGGSMIIIRCVSRLTSEPMRRHALIDSLRLLAPRRHQLHLFSLVLLLLTMATSKYRLYRKVHAHQPHICT